MLPISHSSLHQRVEQLQEKYGASKGSRVSIGDTFRACVGSCRSLFRLKPVHSDNTHDWTASDPLQHPAVSWQSPASLKAFLWLHGLHILKQTMKQLLLRGNTRDCCTCCCSSNTDVGYNTEGEACHAQAASGASMDEMISEGLE